MSEKTSGGRSRRSDAEANTARIRTAALDLLGRGADPSMAEVATAAGVSRQTLYSHYPRREALYAALVTQLTTEVAAVLDTDPPDDPVAGLSEWLDRAWRLIDAHPALLNPALFAGLSTADPVQDHEPVLAGLRQILVAADERDLLADDTTTEWLEAGVIALGHAAGQQVAAGRMGRTEAGAAFRSAALRLCLAR